MTYLAQRTSVWLLGVHAVYLRERGTQRLGGRMKRLFGSNRQLSPIGSKSKVNSQLATIGYNWRYGFFLMQWKNGPDLASVTKCHGKSHGVSSNPVQYQY